MRVMRQLGRRRRAHRPDPTSLVVPELRSAVGGRVNRAERRAMERAARRHKHQWVRKEISWQGVTHFARVCTDCGTREDGWS